MYYVVFSETIFYATKWEGEGIFIGAFTTTAWNIQLKARQSSNLCGHKCRGCKGETLGPQLDSQNPARTPRNAGQIKRAGFFYLFYLQQNHTLQHFWMVNAGNQSLLKIVLLMTCLKNVTFHCNKLARYLKPTASFFFLKAGNNSHCKLSMTYI